MGSRDDRSASALVAVLLVLVLGALAWVVLTGDGAGAGDERAELASGATPDVAPPMRLAPLDAEPAPPAAPLDVPPAAPDVPLTLFGATSDSPTSELLVTGRVLADGGRPVPGAHVVYVPKDAGRRALGLNDGPFGHAKWEALASTRSDATGRFELAARDLVSTLSQPADVFAAVAGSISVRADGFELATRVCPAPVAPGRLDVGDILLVPGGRVVGRVVDASGVPVAGAVLLPPDFMSYGPDERAGEWALVTGLCRAETTPDGRFELTSLWEGEIQFRVRAAGFAPTTIDASAHAGETTDAGDVVLERGGVITGVLVDGEGAPLADVEVFARPEDLASPPGRDRALAAWQVRMASTEAEEVHTRSDAEGRFSLADLPTSSRYAVLAGADGREPAMLADVAADTHDLRLVLQREAEILLVVRDAASGELLADASADGTRLSDEQPSPWDASLRSYLGQDVLRRRGTDGDPTGLVLLTRAGRRNVIDVSAPGHAGAHLLVEDVVAPSRVEREVRLSAGAHVSGTVVDETGAPVADALITVQSGDPELYADSVAELPPVTLTGGDGTFDLDGIAPGALRLMASAEGYLASEVAALDVPETGDVTGVTLVLRRAGRIEGLLLGPDGRPRSRVSVNALGDAQPRPPEHYRSVSVHGDRLWYDGVPGPQRYGATSGDDGTFVVDALPADTYALDASPGGEARVAVAAGETTRVTLRLRTPPTLVGVVLDAQGPVPEAEVSASGVGGRRTGRQRATTGADGRFRLELPTAGRFLLAARVRERYTSALSLELDWDETREVELLGGSCALSGVVRAGDGAPLADATVRLEPRDLPGATSFVTTLQTDADGRFSGDGFAPGAHLLIVRADGWVQREPLVVTLAPDAPADGLQVVLERAAVLDLRVVRPDDGSGMPLRASLDRADAEPAATHLELDLPPDGRLRFDSLRDGDWTLRVLEKRDGMWDAGDRSAPLAERTLHLAPGETRVETVTLDD